MGPHTDNQDEIITVFKKAKIYFDRIKAVIPTVTDLSMGMSNDYKIALNEGSTMIRSAVFYINNIKQGIKMLKNVQQFFGFNIDEATIDDDHDDVNLKFEPKKQTAVNDIEMKTHPNNKPVIKQEPIAFDVKTSLKIIEPTSYDMSWKLPLF